MWLLHSLFTHFKHRLGCTQSETNNKLQYCVLLQKDSYKKFNNVLKACCIFGDQNINNIILYFLVSVLHTCIYLKNRQWEFTDNSNKIIDTQRENRICSTWVINIREDKLQKKILRGSWNFATEKEVENENFGYLE